MDYGGIRFVGAGYLGAATPFKVRQLVSQLENDKTHVLLLHAGPDYFVGEGGGFSPAELQAINEKTCYLALGHIHRPMRHGDWACNPGSLENCNVSEASYDRDFSGRKVGRGYAVLEIDPAHRHELRGALRARAPRIREPRTFDLYAEKRVPAVADNRGAADRHCIARRQPTTQVTVDHDLFVARDVALDREPFANHRACHPCRLLPVAKSGSVASLWRAAEIELEKTIAAGS